MKDWRNVVLVVLAVAGVAVALSVAPLSQDPAYHAFADQRRVLGVPNFWNVVSNAPFAVIGLLGLRALSRVDPRERPAWSVFFAAEVMTALGSAYYHAWPANPTLAWDRLPLAVMLAAFFVVALTERVDVAIGCRALWPAVFIAAASVLHWSRSDDLRPYLLVQFYPVVALPLIAALYPARYSHGWTLPATWVLYVAAKACELADRYSLGGLSGHTWKHLLGAAASAVLLYGLARRSPVQNTEVVRAGTVRTPAA